MISLPPTYVIDKIVHRWQGSRRGGLSHWSIQAAEVNNRLGFKPGSAHVGTCIAVASVVDHVVADRPYVADREPLRIGSIRNIGGLSRKLRCAAGTGIH